MDQEALDRLKRFREQKAQALDILLEETTDWTAKLKQRKWRLTSHINRANKDIRAVRQRLFTQAPT